MAISENLSRRVEADVKGSQEAAVESQVKNALSEIKNKFKYTESYISTLYDSGFKAYLKSKTFNSPENLGKEIIAINNIKQRLIRQGLEAKKSAEHSSTWGPYLYRLGGISKDIHNNSAVQNVIKGVIDELCAIPDMITQIAKIGLREFGKSLWKLANNPKDLRRGLKQAYGDAFTQGFATPEAQYRTGRSATLIVLTFLPGGAAKFGLNVTRLRAITRGGVSKITTKAAIKSEARTAGKTAAKRMEQGTRSVAKKTEQGLKNQKGSSTMYGELNGGARNYAQRQVEKDAVKITRETQTATKAGRVAEMPVKGFYKKRADLLRKGLAFGDKIPVIKQINSIGRWTFRKLDKGTEAAVKKLHPKFYEKLTKQEATLQKVKATAEGAAKHLSEQTAKVERISRMKAKLESTIAEIKKAQARNKINNFGFEEGYGKKLLERNNNFDLNRLKIYEDRLSLATQRLKEAKKVESGLKRKLKNANEKYLIHQSIVEGMNEAQRAGKLALWIETQQVISILDRSQIATLDREIEEAISQIDESYDEIIEEAEPIIEEVENLLKEFEGIASGLESGQTEFINDSISIDLPEGIKLAEIDTSKYRIIITGLASKTGSREVNERIAKQRAENAKKILMEKYGIKDEGQINIQIDLQSDHPDRLNDNLSDWQGAKIKLEPLNESESNPTVKAEGDEGDPDAALAAALADVEDA